MLGSQNKKQQHGMQQTTTDAGEEDTDSFVKGLDASRTVCDQAALLCQPSKSTNKLLSVTGLGNVARQVIEHILQLLGLFCKAPA